MWAETFGPMAVGKTFLLRAIRTASPNTYLRTCRAANPEEFPLLYTELCDKIVELHEENSISRKRTKLNPPIFETRLRRVALAQKSDGMVLFDESLMQSALAYSLAVGNDLKLVEEFVRLMPKPDFAIACLAPKDIILKRCAERVKQGGPNRSANTLDLVGPTAVIAAVLAERGVDCINVNTEISIDALVKNVMERLQKHV